MHASIRVHDGYRFQIKLALLGAYPKNQTACGQQYL